MKKRNREDYLRILNAITLRIEKRIDTLVLNNPISANSIIYSDWSTSTERSLLHFCKTQISALDNAERPDVITRHRLIIELSKITGKRRSVVREETKSLSIPQLSTLLGEYNV